MFAIIRLAEGYSLAFAWVCLFFVLGYAILPFGKAHPGDRRSSSLLRIVVTCAAGMSAYGLLLFALAASGIFFPATELAGFVLLFLCAAFANRKKFLSRAYWRTQLDVVLSSVDSGLFAVVVAALVVGVPSVVSSNLQSDAMNYHLPYALEWARAGRLTVNPFLQFPFYANNYLLFYAQILQLGGGIFICFFSWVMGLLTAVSVYAAIRRLCAESSRGFATVTGSIAAVSVLLCPVYLRWLNTAYVDAAIGAFALMAIMAFHLSTEDRSERWLYAAAIIGGFFVGLKASLLILLPVIALGLVVLSGRMAFPRRVIALTLTVLVICASPWYLRNLVLAGDPIPPTLNIALHGRDGIMTKDEWQHLQSDFRMVPAPSEVPTVPLRAFLDPTSHPFRDDGTSGIVLMIYACVISFGAALAFRRLSAQAAVYGTGAAALVLYWLVTSTLLRYSIIFMPAIVVAFVASLHATLKTSLLARCVVGIGLIICLIPSPSAIAAMPQGTDFYRRQYYGYYCYLLRTYTSDDAYLARMIPHYDSEEEVSELVQRVSVRPRVYLFSPIVRYYFERHGIQAIGEWEGPSGYYRLLRAIQADVAAQYMRNLDATAVLITSTGPLAGFAQPLVEQLAANGYCMVHLSGGDVAAIDVTPSRCTAERRGPVALAAKSHPHSVSVHLFEDAR